MNIVVMGAPGVGKGTYSEMLSEKYNIPQISTGEILRNEIKKETEIGKKVKEIMNSGGFAPDILVIKIVRNRLEKKDCNNGFLLDGFPRTVPQAEALEQFIKIDKVLNFTAPMETIMDRLGGRRVCKKCSEVFHIKNLPPKMSGICDKCGGELYQRKDDRPESIKKRMETYIEKTKPLINFYKKRGLLAEIDAHYPIEESDKVINQIENVLKK
jgi:adenylate kinase